jgi:hypothetical protein
LKIKIYIVFFLLICKYTDIFSQIGIVKQKGIGVFGDSVRISNDTLPNPSATSPWDKFYNNLEKKDTIGTKQYGYTLSKDAIQDEVKYNARDSSWIDLVNNKIHLYGGAEILYNKMKITANYMVINFTSGIIEGFQYKDDLPREKAKPTFSDGENTFTYKEIRYNFKSRKGLVQHAITQQGEFNLVGSTTKYIGGQTDSLNIKEDDRIYNRDAIITTCTHDPPHYGIRAGKLKFVPNKVAVLSVAQVEIANVPTPIFLPFGFFPLVKGKSSGLIFPSSYEYNAQLGLGFREIGYYYPINQNVDMRITGDIYTRGSHALRVNTNYKKRYGYSGNILLGYTNTKLESDKDGSTLSQKSFSINIRHSQDSKAHPYRNLGGSINIQTNRYDQRTYENPAAALQNTYSSNFTFSHDMPGTPFRFNAEFRHSQNTKTRVMDITLPNMTLRMNTIFPFKRKNSTGERWTDNIALSYSSEFRNFVKTTDTTLFTTQTLNNLQTGLQQKASLSTNLKVLKYLNVSPNIMYDETWLLKKYKLTFNPDSVRYRDKITFDTLGFKPPEESFVSELGAFRNFNAGIAVNTQIFGTYKRSTGFFRGIRHVMKPNLNFYYKPGNKEQYEAVVNTDTRPALNTPRKYSVYSNGPFGTLNGSEEQMGLSYGITNIFEAKYWSKKDTSEKVVRLFDNFGINGSYNFAADSFRWSSVSVVGNTTVLRGLTNFNFRAQYSPYAYDKNGRITKTTVWDAQKRLLQFRTFSGQFSTSISFRQIRELISGKKETQQNKAFNNNNNQPATVADPNSKNDEKPEKETPKETALADWFQNFTISHAFNFELQNIYTKDTFYIGSHSININGAVPLTKKWTMNIGNIAYDFKNKSFVYPYFTFARDLHCWQMNFTWAPTNGVYSFYIGVKSSALSFLKYDYGQRNANTLFSGQRR